MSDPQTYSIVTWWGIENTELDASEEMTRVRTGQLRRLASAMLDDDRRTVAVTTSTEWDALRERFIMKTLARTEPRPELDKFIEEEIERRAIERDRTRRG